MYRSCCEVTQPGLHLLQHIPYKVMDYWQTPGDDMKLLLGYYSLGAHPTNLKLAVERIILAEHGFGRFSTQVRLWPLLHPGEACHGRL